MCFITHYRGLRKYLLNDLYNNNSIGCRERGSHARGVYPTQDTLRMGTARVKQEEEAGTRKSKKYEKRTVGTIRGKVPNQD